LTVPSLSVTINPKAVINSIRRLSLEASYDSYQNKHPGSRRFSHAGRI
jgi:hypothetical protein